MKRWEAWWNHAALVAVSLTGIAYGIVRYFLHNPDPDSALGHPWQPFLLKAHILVAPFAVFGVGLLLRRHALARRRSGEINGRRTGNSMLWLFLPLVLSGYLVQVITGREAARAVGWTHAALGVFFALGYALHPRQKETTDTGADETENGNGSGSIAPAPLSAASRDASTPVPRGRTRTSRDAGSRRGFRAFRRGADPDD